MGSWEGQCGDQTSLAGSCFLGTDKEREHAWEPGVLSNGKPMSSTIERGTEMQENQSFHAGAFQQKKIGTTDASIPIRIQEMDKR